MHTDVDQVADHIYRISTCIPDLAPGGFTFNQFLVDAEEPLLYHSGMRSLFPLVREAVDRVMPVGMAEMAAGLREPLRQCARRRRPAVSSSTR